MLKNRQIEMRLVKRNKKDDTVSDEPTIKIEEVTTNAVTLLDLGGKKVLKMVAAYIVLDTARKIAVSRLGK